MIEKFIHAANVNIFTLCSEAKDIMEALKSYEAPETRYNLDWPKRERKALA